MNQLKIPLNCFENRYTIHHPVLRDLPALLHLETECWPEPLRASPDEIRERIEERPEDHCVLNVYERIVGVIFSQRIACVDVLKKTTSTRALTLYTPDGPVIQLLDEAWSWYQSRARRWDKELGRQQRPRHRLFSP